MRSPIATRLLVTTAFCAALTGALSWIIIPLPFSPVPVSGQTIGVMVAGLLLPPRWALISQAVYLLIGSVGLPVFAGGLSGPGVLFGPTGGYLWGFLLAALTISHLLRQTAPGHTFRIPLILITGGIVCIYIPGIIQLSLVTGLPLKAALQAGVWPFLPGDLAKVVLVSLLERRLSAALYFDDYQD